MATAAPDDVMTRGVLVVDDDVLVRRALARMIRSFGLRAVEAASGAAALAAVAQEPALALVVLDLQIPYPDGLAVLEAIRRDPALDHLQVLVCTSIDDVGTVHLALSGGAAGYCVKPISAAALRVRLVDLGVLPPR